MAARTSDRTLCQNETTNRRWRACDCARPRIAERRTTPDDFRSFSPMTCPSPSSQHAPPSGLFQRRQVAGLLSVVSVLAVLAGCATFDRVFPPTEGVAVNPMPVETRCAAVTAPGHRLPSGRTNEAVAALARPSKGEALAEPVYGNCLIRVTVHDVEPPPGYVRNDYARRQPFNADGTLMLFTARDGTWHLYDARTLAWVKRLSFLAGDAEPQWHPTNPALLYFTPRSGLGMRLFEMDVRRESRRVVGDFGARLGKVWPTAATAWTKGEGSPSADGRYWCFMVDDKDWKGVGVFSWDLQTDTVLGMMDMKGVRPDHVSMSPGGRHCVVSTDEKGVGTRAWTRDFKSHVPLHHKSEHSDLAVDSDGRDVYVSIDYQSPRGDVFMTDLESGKRTVLFPTYLEGSATAIHFSGRGFGQPGWVVMSTYGEPGEGKKPQWLHHKVFVVGLTANPIIRTLAHHRGRYKGYLSEPHASVSRDFTRILFNSNWGAASENDIDVYMITLPMGALLE
jgi:hypothetical protein